MHVNHPFEGIRARILFHGYPVSPDRRYQIQNQTPNHEQTKERPSVTLRETQIMKRKHYRGLAPRIEKTIHHFDEFEDVHEDPDMKRPPYASHAAAP